MSGDASNLGETDNYRVPDFGIHRSIPDAVLVPTAAMVIEVVSPGDESWQKFDHYAAYDVDEVLIADPRERTLDLFVLEADAYARSDRSTLLGITLEELVDRISWPEP